MCKYILKGDSNNRIVMQIPHPKYKADKLSLNPAIRNFCTLVDVRPYSPSTTNTPSNLKREGSNSNEGQISYTGNPDLKIE